jgi:hypothetical protein
MMPNCLSRSCSSLAAGLVLAAGLGVGLTQIAHADQIVGRQRPGAAGAFSQAESVVVAERLFRATVNRDADARGVAQAAAEVQKGNLTQQVNSMVASPEFRQVIADKTPAQILEQFYSGMLKRQPDRAGIDAFTPRIAARQYGAVLLEMANSPEFRSSLSSTAAPGGPAITSRLDAALNCQARVLAAVTRDVTGRTFLSFDRMPETSQDNRVISGAAVDRFDGDRQMTYRCDGNDVTYSYNDRGRSTGKDVRERFDSVAVNNCLDAGNNEFGGATIRAAALSASDTRAEYVLGHAIGNNNSSVQIVCEMDVLRVVNVRRR